MAHRALVAAARGDGRYEVSLAPDGAADWLLEPLLCPDASVPAELLGGTPVGTSGSLEGVLAAHLDPGLHEALVVVDADGRPTPHAVVPYVLGTADGLLRGEPSGAVVGLVGADGGTIRPAYVRGVRHGAADVLAEAVDAGLLGPGEALAWLDGAVRRLAAGGHRVLPVPPDG